MIVTDRQFFYRLPITWFSPITRLLPITNHHLPVFLNPQLLHAGAKGVGFHTH